MDVVGVHHHCEYQFYYRIIKLLVLKLTFIRVWKIYFHSGMEIYHTLLHDTIRFAPQIILNKPFRLGDYPLRHSAISSPGSVPLLVLPSPYR
jgi:hypothetical protein